jgi:phosphomannomutase
MTTAGVRGIVGEALTPSVVVRFAQAFGTYIDGGTVYVSRDTRKSGEMIAASLRSGLMACGCGVVDLGVIPTAALQLEVKRLRSARGGIAVTAGHSGAEWNALKFIREDGIFLNARQAEELLDTYHQGNFLYARWDELRPSASTCDAGEKHLQAILKQLDADRIAKRRFKVAVDCANGACSEFSPRLLEMLGCEVVPINTETDVIFPHPPLPTKENLSQLRAMVRATGADIGFAHDADGDRLGFVCEDGGFPGEETTLCLAAAMVLERGDRGPVVTNLSSTMAVDDIARQHGSSVIRTKVGQTYITEAALNYRAAIAGEGSGGIVFPRLNYAHDSLAAMGHLLQLMASEGKPISRIVSEKVPRYVVFKEEIRCASELAFSLMEQIRRLPQPDWASERDLQDGCKLAGDGCWVHVRVSQTEPVIRVIAEARTRAQAEDLVHEYVQDVRQRI